MNFNLSEEHLMIRDAARDFAQNELLPGVIERDTNQTFPHEQIKQLGELGFMGMMVDPNYGGSGLDTLSYVLAMEELSKIDASASVVVSVNNSLVCWGLDTFGNEEQKAKYLPKLAAGEHIGAFCLSEPEAGSDATSQSTTAVDMGDHYLLTGTKNWITNGGRSDFISVHVPGGDLIGASELAKMKDGVVLLNAARGGVINEEALLDALESGKVAGAGLDVFVNEPTPAVKVLMNGKLSVTPHIGAATLEAQDRIGTELAAHIDAI